MISFLLANWRAVGFGAVILIFSAAVGIQTFRLDLCQKGRHEDQVAAEAVRIQLEGSLQAQSEAVAKLGRESADRKAKAQKAVKAAQEGTKAARSEAERLRGLASAPRPTEAPSACPAGEAVREIRKGLIANG